MHRYQANRADKNGVSTPLSHLNEANDGKSPTGGTNHPPQAFIHNNARSGLQSSLLNTNLSSWQKTADTMFLWSIIPSSHKTGASTTAKASTSPN